MSNYIPDVKKLEERIKILERALKQYGSHEDHCGFVCSPPPDSQGEVLSECTCGLTYILENIKFYIGKRFFFQESQDECHEMEITSLDGNTGIAESLRDGGVYNFKINEKDILIVQN